MTDKQLLENMRGIADELLKNAAHSFGIDFGRLNDTLIEIERRLAELKRKES